MTVQVLTANRLGDGAVVYRSQAGAWSEHLNESRILASSEEAAQVLAEAETAQASLEIVGPYLMPVEDRNGQINPTEMREFIRAKGPSISFDAGYQPETSSHAAVG